MINHFIISNDEIEMDIRIRDREAIYVLITPKNTPTNSVQYPFIVKRKGKVIFEKYFDIYSDDITGCLTSDGGKLLVNNGINFMIFDLRNGNKEIFTHPIENPQNCRCAIPMMTPDEKYFHTDIGNSTRLIIKAADLDSVEFKLKGLIPKKFITTKHPITIISNSTKYLVSKTIRKFVLNDKIVISKKYDYKYFESYNYIFTYDSRYLVLANERYITIFDAENGNLLKSFNAVCNELPKVVYNIDNKVLIDNDFILDEDTLTVRKVKFKETFLKIRYYLFDLRELDTENFYYDYCDGIDYHKVILCLPKLRVFLLLQREYPLIFPDGVLEVTFQYLLTINKLDLIKFLVQYIKVFTKDTKDDFIDKILEFA